MAAVLVSFAILLSLANNGFVQGKVGFSIDLIHRDSPKSPYYNPSETVYDRLSKAVLRSTSRANFFRDSLKLSSSVSLTDVRSLIVPDNGEYLMELSFGTPPVKTLAIADTGSDLIWIQCNPCNNCYPQDAPYFDPEGSSTYRDLSCQSSFCSALRTAYCNDSQCLYSYSYEDQSFTNGSLATETLTFDSTTGSSVELPNITFGCGHNNNGIFGRKESGLVGLGAGLLSLVSQLFSFIEGKFSYCLAPVTDSSPASTLNFGDSATVSGSDVVTLPLVTRTGAYFVNLESISVGSKKVEVEDGNIILDSGTTLTLLESNAFSQLVSVLKDAIDLTPTQDPSGTYELCYQASQDAQFPDITFSFTGGDLVLPRLNTFVPVSDGVICLAMMGSDRPFVFGNIGQTNFKVGYDLVGKEVRFAPTDCSKNN